MGRLFDSGNDEYHEDHCSDKVLVYVHLHWF